MKAIRKSILVCGIAMTMLPAISSAGQIMSGNVSYLYVAPSFVNNTYGPNEFLLVTVTNGSTSLSCGTSAVSPDDGRLALLSNAHYTSRMITISCDDNGMLIGTQAM